LPQTFEFVSQITRFHKRKTQIVTKLSKFNEFLRNLKNKSVCEIFVSRVLEGGIGKLAYIHWIFACSRFIYLFW